MKLKELLCELQGATDKLKGRDIRKKCAAELIGEAVSRLSCCAPPLSFHDDKLWYDTEAFGELPIIEFAAQYDEDKRTCDGLGYRIARINVELTQDLSVELDISELNRPLQNDAARKRKQEALDNIRKLEQQISDEKKTLKQLNALIGQNNG